MNDIEIWKDIKGYEGMYQVSNLGNIKSLERYKDLVEIEKEHKKENGELREQVKEIEKQRNDVAWRLSNLTEKIEGILNKYKYTELGNDEEIINFYKELQELLEERN